MNISVVIIRKGKGEKAILVLWLLGYIIPPDPTRGVANSRHRGLFPGPRCPKFLDGCPKFLDDAAGHKHADVVQDRIQIEAKDDCVQIRIRVERLAVTAQHDEESEVDVQCRGRKNGEACARESHPLGHLQASVASRALDCGRLVAQDVVDWLEEEQRHHDGEDRILRKVEK